MPGVGLFYDTAGLILRNRPTGRGNQPFGRRRPPLSRKGKMLLSQLPYLTLLTALLLLPSFANAVTLCSAPVSPSCVEMKFTYEEDASVTRCKTDLDKFTKETDEYVACLRGLIDETKRKTDSLREEFERRSGTRKQPQDAGK